MDTSSTNLQPHENSFGEFAKCREKKHLETEGRDGNVGWRRKKWCEESDEAGDEKFPVFY